MPGPDDRQQVADIPDGNTVDVQAHEVNTFAPPVVQPPPENDRAHAIAEGLSRFIPSLIRFGTATMDTMSEKDMAVGQAARVKSQQDWATAVRNGNIPPGASPWFRMGYDKMDMTLQAQKYDEALQVAYAQSSARHSTKPDDLASFQQAFQQKWYQDNPNVTSNPMFGHIFAPMAAQAANKLQQTHASDIIADTEQKAQDSLSELVSGQIGTRLLHPNEDTLIQNIQGFVDHAYAMGMPGRQANEIAARAIQRQAVIEGDLSVLDYINKLKGQGGASIGATAWAKELVKEGQLQIFDRQRQMEQYQWALHEHQKTLALEGGSRDAIQRLIQDPTADLRDIASKVSQYDPEAGINIMGMRKRFQQSIEDDPRVVANAQSKILSGTLTQSDIVKLANDGQISTQTVDTLSKNLEISKRHEDVLKAPMLEHMVSDLGQSITGNDTLMKEIDPSLIAKAAKAKQELMMGVLKWKEANPNANDVDMWEYAGKYRDILLKEFNSKAAQSVKGQGLSEEADRIDAKIQLDTFKEQVQPLKSDPEARAKFMAAHNLVSQQQLQDFINKEYQRLSDQAAAKGKGGSSKP